MRRAITIGSGVGGAALAYTLVVRGALTLDLGLGRRLRPLGPLHVNVAAPRETVFDIIAEPYLGRTPRALGTKLEVLERGSDMALAAHFTPVGTGLTATTVETVRFERPERVAFRLLRGPVPHVLETFELREAQGETEVEYRGELGTDLWDVGRLWGTVVARPWEQAVAASLSDIRVEAERRVRFSPPPT